MKIEADWACIPAGYKINDVETVEINYLDKEDLKNEIQIIKKNKKIEVIGIPTHNRVISGFGITKNNIPFYIRQWIEKNRKMEKHIHD